MSKVLCFGELLLRLSPDVEAKWLNNNFIMVYVGGAELNVATALSKWEIPVRYFSALPNNLLSIQILKYLQEKNIDSSSMQLSGSRIGIYYLPQGSDVKNAGVIYDRAHSSFSQLQKGIIDWDKVLDGITWFHFSAICPAINQHLADVCEEALQVCVKKNINVSVDLNYRSKLWQYGKCPDEVMPGLMKYCNVIMGNLWAVESLLGIATTIKESTGKTNEELKEAAKESMLMIHKQYPLVSTMAFTFRLEDKYWAMVQHGKDLKISKQFKIKNVIDKVGSGDSFMAGLLYGLYHQNPLQQITDFATAAAVQKLFIKGDSITKTSQEINAFINNYE